ncbi:MAG: hypothetical protein JWN74_2587 [Acidobacteriaceae bacterium]|nr:hypothetical protein [Acidobacteriaceae bacterium]
MKSIAGLHSNAFLAKFDGCDSAYSAQLPLLMSLGPDDVRRDRRRSGVHELATSAVKASGDWVSARDAGC